MKKILATITLLLSVMVVCNAFALPTGKITMKVVDETGVPVEGATAYISFSKPEARGIGVADILKKRVTGRDGFFTAQSPTMDSIGISAEKGGYYHSNVEYKFPTRNKLLNRWEPWNPVVEVILKKKRNPVGMYMKGTFGLKIPEFDKPIGFDLEKGDWVTPYGTGMVSDFIFTMNVVDRAYTDYECGFTLTFSNPYDGIQEYFFNEIDQSYFKWPFQAPAEGYIEKISREKSISPGKGYKSNEKKSVHYIFRIRTKTDDKGNIIEALYGKLGSEFKFSPAGEIVFGYYFNPNGTRNLEEDPKRNLFDKK